MKKNPKQLVAVIVLAAIAALIIAFVISAFSAGPGEAGNHFMALLFCIIAIPILAWVILFCIGRTQDKRKFFPEEEKNTEEHN